MDKLLAARRHDRAADDRRGHVATADRSTSVDIELATKGHVEAPLVERSSMAVGHAAVVRRGHSIGLGASRPPGPAAAAELCCGVHSTGSGPQAFTRRRRKPGPSQAQTTAATWFTPAVNQVWR